MDNPAYDPHWPARLEAARTAHAEAAAQAAFLARQDLGGTAHRQAIDLLERAKQALAAAECARFETLAAYARFRFAGLPPSRDDFAVLPDFASFTSLAAIDEAIARTEAQRREGTDGGLILLRDAQPPGLAAFADPASVVSSWRHFPELHTVALVSFCETPGEIHLCIAHRWGRLGSNSNRLFLLAATDLARETITLRLPGAATLYQNDGHRHPSNRETLRAANLIAAKLRLYRHLLPAAGQKEEFSAVTATWEGARFIDPDWEAQIFASLPEALRDAAIAAPPALPALPKA